MLGRLFKYELKATSKVLVPIYIAFIAITIISRVSIDLQVDEGSLWSFINGMGLFVFIISAITMFVATAIVIIWRFYRNTSSDEGYLLFTLPVKVDYIIISEFLCALIWGFLMSVFAVLGIFLMIFNRNVDDNIINFIFWQYFIIINSRRNKSNFLSFLRYININLSGDYVYILCNFSCLII